MIKEAFFFFFLLVLILFMVSCKFVHGLVPFSRGGGFYLWNFSDCCDRFDLIVIFRIVFFKWCSAADALFSYFLKRPFFLVYSAPYHLLTNDLLTQPLVQVLCFSVD